MGHVPGGPCAEGAYPAADTAASSPAGGPDHTQAACGHRDRGPSNQGVASAEGKIRLNPGLA